MFAFDIAVVAQKVFSIKDWCVSEKVGGGGVDH